MKPDRIPKSFLFALFLIVAILPYPVIANTVVLESSPQNTPENIQIWYGEEQQSGIPGLSQRWVNIPGRVLDTTHVSGLSFSLNNGPETLLNIGPDSRRLAAPGDFNIEIDANALRPGKNDLRISMAMEDGSRVNRQITVEHALQPWPLPYRIDWAGTKSVLEAVQVVDGLWQLTGSGVRTSPEHVGYDRLLAIGDTGWSSYETLVPFTVNKIDASAYDSPESVSPGFGLILHWTGHTSTPVDCRQPHCGWLPAGAIIWYSFPLSETAGLNINTRPVSDLSVALPYELETGTTYMMRARAEVYPFRTLYALKFWPEQSAEPEGWHLQQAADRTNPNHGGVLFVAHHVDLTLGNIEAAALNGGNNVPPREYLVLLPLVLTVMAGLLFLTLYRTKRESGRSRSKGIVLFSLAGIAVSFYLEPRFPILLERHQFNAATAGALHIGHDFALSLFQGLIWIVIILSSFRKTAKEAGR